MNIETNTEYSLSSPELDPEYDVLTNAIGSLERTIKQEFQHLFRVFSTNAVSKSLGRVATHESFGGVLELAAARKLYSETASTKKDIKVSGTIECIVEWKSWKQKGF